MAVIYQTTLVPSKLELLTAWLPRQDWYQGQPGGPSLAKVGGFRLDDPAGQVGIEFMVVRDDAAREVTAYLVPMTYRDAALPGADARRIGTAEHGVLGLRWIYDGTQDPVLVAQLAELIRGRVQAQAQSQSDTPDATIRATPVAAPRFAIDFERVLKPAPADSVPGQVTGPWTAPDGMVIRSVLAAARPLLD